MPADWNLLASFKAHPTLPPAYPTNVRSFYAPQDHIHALLVALLSEVSQSLVLNMYGYDDDQLNNLVLAIARDPHKYVQISLDASQAIGPREQKLVAQLQASPGTNVAIGTSTRHAISHLKVAILDGLYTITGSTNWSMSGENDQDNQLLVFNDPAIAAEARTILDANHAYMLSQSRPQPNPQPNPQHPARPS